MEWNSNLPDVSTWQPRFNGSDTLSNGLLMACRAAQNRIITEADIEISFNIDNFDSGAGIEDIVRQELSRLLPERYLVDAGVVNDSDGRTAGDYDIVIRNEFWAPVTKLGATPESRRYHFPIESVYSVIEIKQSIGLNELDEAMEKLVKIARLNRPVNPYGHITENQHLTLFDKEGFVLNPLRTTVLATRLKENVAFRDIAHRFNLINADLQRHEMVTDLYVLGHGSVSYSTQQAGHRFLEADFMRDRQQPLAYGISDRDEDRSKVFYSFYVAQLGHLTRSVLGIHDIAGAYGKRLDGEYFITDNAKYNRP